MFFWVQHTSSLQGVRFTVSYCCIGHYVNNYDVDIIKYKYGDYFAKQNESARENIFHTTKYYVPKGLFYLNFFGEIGGGLG